jgi:ribonuclease HI
VDQTYRIFTDGSAIGNPGPGGWQHSLPIVENGDVRIVMWREFNVD